MHILRQRGNSNIQYAMAAGHKVDKMMNLNSHIGGRSVVFINEGSHVTDLCSPQKQGSDLLRARRKKSKIENPLPRLTSTTPVMTSQHVTTRYRVELSTRALTM